MYGFKGAHTQCGVCGITPKSLMFMPLVFSDIASLEVVNSKNTV